jgi:sensor histidine kinase YesM
MLSSAAATSPTTALASVWRRWLKRSARTALVLFSICVGIALLLTTLDGGGFVIKLIFSSCIGVSCTLVYDLGWFAQAWGHDRWRAWRRLPPDAGVYGGGWSGVLPAAAMCVLLGPPLGQAIADRLLGFSSPSLWDLSSTSSRVTLVISLLATIVLVLIISTAERLAHARAEAERAQRQAAETQLRLLQSQLEPHMLFNTLANLRVLIGLDAARAQDMLDHLIAFLRATLAASRSQEHALAEEFSRSSDYLALMTIRMGPRLAVSLDLPAALKHLPVPPLLLQPLVENSIQHGLEPKVEGGQVQISARREGDMLLLCVQDSGVGREAAQRAARGGSGFGLGGVRERLATLYGNRASVLLEDAPGGGTLVSLRLPIVPVPSMPAPSEVQMLPPCPTRPAP